MTAAQHRVDIASRIDAHRIQHDIERLSAITSTPGEGVTRLAYSDQETAARNWVKAELEAAGLNVIVDPVGNLMGRFPSASAARAIAVGSHIDSVKHGGPFDGAAGSVATLECARAIAEIGPETVGPVEFICFAAEESARFGSRAGRIGSRAMAGLLPQETLAQSKDTASISIAEAMRLQGLDPTRMSQAARRAEELAAFLELHIEQGTVLAKSSVSVGCVTSIAGATRLSVTLTGRADHSGGTPMSDRQDALAGAAEAIFETERMAAQEHSQLVATVGSIAVLPNLVTVVPGEVTITVDIRDVDGQAKARFVQRLEQAISSICSRRHLRLEIRRDRDDDPTPMSSRLSEQIMKSAETLGVTSMEVVSHTGHDASSMAQLVDAGMIFVRNPSGRSHCPDEVVELSDLSDGARVLLQSLVDLGAEVTQR